MIFVRTILRMKRMRLMVTLLTMSPPTPWPPLTSSMDLSWPQKQKRIQNPRSNSNDRVQPVMRYSTMQGLVFPIKTANRFAISNLMLLQSLHHYQCHTPATPTTPPQSPASTVASRSISEVLSFLTELPSSILVLVTLVLGLFLITCHLVIRLEELQKRVESETPLPRSSGTTIEQLVGWQNLLYSQSSKKIKEYLELNLQQIARVSFKTSLLA